MELFIFRRNKNFNKISKLNYNVAGHSTALTVGQMSETILISYPINTNKLSLGAYVRVTSGFGDDVFPAPVRGDEFSLFLDLRALWRRIPATSKANTHVRTV